MPSGTRTVASTVAAASVWQVLALRPALVSTVTRYGHTGDGDVSMFTMDEAAGVTSRAVTVSGGVTVTLTGGTERWGYANIHGDTLAWADGAGTKQGATLTYHPYGNPGGVSVDVGYGWLGRYRKLADPGLSTVLVQMGARTYLPVLGRFLQVDPVLGGSANDYDYVGADPINGYDLDGRWMVTWRGCSLLCLSVGIGRDRHKKWYKSFGIACCSLGAGISIAPREQPKVGKSGGGFAEVCVVLCAGYQYEQWSRRHSGYLGLPLGKSRGKGIKAKLAFGLGPWVTWTSRIGD